MKHKRLTALVLAAALVLAGFKFCYARKISVILTVIQTVSYNELVRNCEK